MTGDFSDGVWFVEFASISDPALVPQAAWDVEAHTEPPMLMGRHLHLNETLGVYVLHAWIWQNNSAGVFEDWNPAVSCP